MMMMRPIALFLYIYFTVFVFTMDSFRVGSLNVNGVREAKKRLLVFGTARMKHID